MKLPSIVAMPGISDALGLSSSSVTGDHYYDSVEDHEEVPIAIPIHPLGIKPLGNKYAATTNARDSIGVFQSLPDEIIFSISELLNWPSLLHLGATCKALYAFCNSDELWKTIYLELAESDVTSLTWRGSWRCTVLSISPEDSPRVSCDNIFSDVLYRPFLCSHTPLAPYTTGIPAENSICRLKDISPSEFARSWSDKPFILTSPVKDWPVYQSWDTAKLLDQYGDLKFRAEAVDWSLKSYINYMNNTSDESPLYLFDRNFVEKMGLTVGKDQEHASYWVPECFGEDFFSVLGNKRPDSRWLIVGPARSGSTFHKDPNATSAWNAVLRGSKYWIMFPTGGGTLPPPGVFVSEDQSEVTSPLSIAEWLLEFHAEARRTAGCVEGICREGEVLHVPSGWWHLVVNLDPSIAITQNFVPSSHLSSVLSFLRDKAGQVSGFGKDITDPYMAFVQCMDAEQPTLLSEALSELSVKTAVKKRKWDMAVGDDNIKGFTFGFGGPLDSDEEIP